MKMLAALALSLISAVAHAQEVISVNLPYDKAWSGVMQSLVQQGLSIQSHDKDAGLIKIAGTFEHGSYFVCRRRGGHVTERPYEVNIALASSQDGTQVSINAIAKETLYRNKKFLFITVGRVWEERPCESTGELEKRIFGSFL